jgi:hypothetical protein
MKEAFHHNSETRTAKINLQAKGPTAIVIGKPYTVELTLLSPSSSSETGNIIPDFVLISYTLILKTKTTISRSTTGRSTRRWRLGR